MIPVVWALLLALAAPAAMAGEFRIRMAVSEGTGGPGAGPAGLSAFRSIALNARGDLLFEATTAEGNGIYLASGTAVRPLAVVGQPTPVGGVYLGLGFPSLNDAGQVAFLAMVDGGRTPAAILSWSAGALSPVVAIGDAAPEGGQFKELRDVSLGADGGVVFVAAIGNGRSPGGLFLHAGPAGAGGRRLVALLEPAPAPGTFVELAHPRVDGDRIVFHAKLSGDPPRRALVVVSRNGARKVAAEGDPTPLGGVLHELGAPVPGGSGQVAFWASIHEGRAPAALFLTAPGGLRTAVARGDPGPRGSTLSYLGLAGSYLEPHGVAFTADLLGGVARQGVFLAQRGKLRVVALHGDPCPAGSSFESFGPPSLARTGAIAFAATTPGRGGIFVAEPRP